MNRINVLTKELSGRIAAGEVVQNPASVVKELVENSIDAGASSITVEIKNGGIDYIRVTDNGGGIMRDDVALAVQKHATSKISCFEDIKSIASLGFRGEALSSIASVARLGIKTRVPGDDEGTELYYDPSGRAVVKPAGLPDGTTVICENLFYNIPARLKFLKSPGQEGAVISDLMLRMILLRPHIAFRFINNDKVIYGSAGDGDVKNAVLCVYGRSVLGHIKPIEHTGETLKISGYISQPPFFFRSTKNQSIFLNGRYIKSKNISGTINEAYGERLLRGHYPFAVLHIAMPFDMVDVNVHPNKTSVLIYNERKVLEEISAAISNALEERTAPLLELKPQKQQPAEEQKTFFESEAKSYKAPESNAEDTEAEFEDIYLYEDKKKLHEKLIFNEAQSLMAFDEEIKIAPDVSPPVQAAEYGSFTDYSVIGSVFNSFLIVQSGDKVYFLDQHAVHERLNYERIKRKNEIKPQLMLIPQMLTLRAEDKSILLKNTELLSSIGFIIDDFGGNTVKISALPVSGENFDCGVLIDDVIYELTHKGGDITLFRDRIIKKACKMSVKAGQPLSGEEIKTLIEEITKDGVIPVCPHGRPVAIAITKEELEKGFKRLL